MNSRIFIYNGFDRSTPHVVDEWTEVPTCRARRGRPFLSLYHLAQIQLNALQSDPLERFVKLIVVITSKCDEPTAYNYSHQKETENFQYSYVTIIGVDYFLNKISHN